MKEVINLTPHPVNILGKELKIEIPSTGELRLSQERESVGTIPTNLGDIPITKVKFNSRGVKLPPRKEDTIYIVSSLVCQAYPDRSDFFVPDDTVRDEKGAIVGCRSLARNPFLRREGLKTGYQK